MTLLLLPLLFAVLTRQCHGMTADNNTKDNNPSALCTADSFICQGNCIPPEWVADGEPDCEDGSDERPMEVNGTTPASSPPGAEAADPFSTATLPPAKSVADWLAQLEASQANKLFARPLQSGHFLLQGCALLPSAATGQGQQPLDQWARLQMFLCELLGPALRDQPDCLAASAACPAQELNAFASASSLACSLLAQSAAHFRCLEAQPSAECTESALEMLAPLRQESEHWQTELACTTDEMSSTTLEPTDGISPEPFPTESSSPSPPPAPAQSWDVLTLLAQAGELCHGDRPPALDELIWTKLCDRADVFAANKDCLSELARQQGQKCSQQPPEKLVKGENGSCAMLEMFSRNLDCSLHSLNELCPLEAQEAVVGIQEQLNDEAIARQCFQQDRRSGEGGGSVGREEAFSLEPAHGRCTADQEETALLCLAELSELPGRLQRLPSLGALLANRTSLGAICGLFERYEGCLQRRVFNHDGKERETKSAESATKPGTQRCSLNSPLNGLARLGLAPMCANQTRSLANASSPACLASPALARCQGPVEALGRAVQAILHGGSHGPAHLCQAFYSLREAFSCGRLAVNAADCPEGADTFVAMAEMLETVGREEGCPAQAPANLQALLAPAARPPPQARPLPANVASPPLALACPEAGQQQFQRCIQPLSVFQPHPLTVIKQPRQITDACLAFGNFSACRVSLEPNCVPLWARGMAAMFEFACGPGNGPFLEIRQCLRRTVGRPELRQCVIDFSRASPQEACPSSGQLLACAVPVVEEKCGSTAGQFLRDYVGHFATALEPTCPIGQPIRAAPAPPAVLIPSQNCSAEQRQLIEQCGAPLGQLRAQLDGMFQGGLQTLLKNLNGLATLFQQGCALSAQARACLDPVLASPDAGCSVSSCLVAAGVGICEQPDVGAAIDANLGCVFRQVSNPDFGQCIRTTLGPLRQLNLTALRSALPNFVSCVEPIVVQQCGQVPLNVLRVLSSKAECPLAKEAQPSDQQQQKNAPEAVNSCTPSLRKSRQECQSRLLTAKYQFVPGLLLNLSAVEQLGQLCEDLAGVRQCEQETRPCDSEEPYGAARALLALGTSICSSRAEFSRHWECLNAVSQSEEGRVCATPLADVPTGDGVGDQLCGAVNASSQCLAPRLFSDCGPEALHFVFGASNEFLAQMIPGAQCRLETPALALQIGCPEQQLIAFLQCESGLDGFRPRPVALIGNQSKWDEFCAAAQDQFRPCVQALECRPEPATSASLFLHETVCEREIARRDQRQFGPCFLAVTEQEEGRHCLDQFRTVDLLAKNEGAKVCAAVDRLLHCLAKRIHVDCGEEALLHLFDLYNGWANVFHSGCPLSPPELGFGPMKEPKGPEVDFSKDQTSLVIKGSMIEQTNDDVEWVQGSSSSSAVPETSSGDSAETTADVSSEISSSFSSTTSGGTTIMNPSATTTQQSPTTTAAPPAPAADEGKQKEKSSSGARRDGRMADYLLGALASLLLLAVEAGLI